MEQNTHTRLSMAIAWYDAAALAEDVTGYFVALLRAIHAELQHDHPRLEQVRALAGLGDYAANDFLDNLRLACAEADAAITRERLAESVAPADRVESL